jgi:hypothetical protein
MRISEKMEEHHHHRPKQSTFNSSPVNFAIMQQ